MDILLTVVITWALLSMWRGWRTMRRARDAAAEAEAHAWVRELRPDPTDTVD